MGAAGTRAATAGAARDADLLAPLVYPHAAATGPHGPRAAAALALCECFARLDAGAHAPAVAAAGYCLPDVAALLLHQACFATVSVFLDAVGIDGGAAAAGGDDDVHDGPTEALELSLRPLLPSAPRGTQRSEFIWGTFLPSSRETRSQERSAHRSAVCVRPCCGRPTTSQATFSSSPSSTGRRTTMRVTTHRIATATTSVRDPRCTLPCSPAPANSCVPSRCQVGCAQASTRTSRGTRPGSRSCRSRPSASPTAETGRSRLRRRRAGTLCRRPTAQCGKLSPA